MENNKPKKIYEQTTISVNLATKKEVDLYCLKYNITKKNFVSLVMNYLKSENIDITKAPTKADTDRILKRINDVFAFMKTQENKILLPLKDTILDIQEDTSYLAERVRNQVKKQDNAH